MTRKTLPPLPGSRVEVRLAGSGGQGLILAGTVLAEAAGVYDGREVTMARSYGPEARGGASKAEIIIGDKPIDYPLCLQTDLLLALNQEAADTYCWDLKPGALILVDKDLVGHPPSSRALALPFTAEARDKLKKESVVNIIALGVISELTGLVSRRGLEKSLAARVPPHTFDINKKALALGIRLARQYGQKVREIEEASAEDL